jgi:hypothetical protein
MTGELDPFDFALAAALGRTVEEMRATVSNGEYHAWQAYYTWLAAQRELATKEVRRR